MALDLSAVALSPETRALLPLRAGAAPHDELRRFGTWWVAPFARVGLDLVGLRFIPGQPLLECPVVWAAMSATATIASSPRYVVPVIVLAQIMATPHRWLEARELLPREWDELLAAHHALGGEGALEPLRGIVADEALRIACATPGAARDAAAAVAFARVDPAPATERFRQAVLARGAALDERAGAGEGGIDPWAAARAAIAFGGAPHSPDAAWRLFASPAGLDLAWADTQSPFPEPEPAPGARLLWKAAKLLASAQVPAAWRADPLWPAIAALAAADNPFSFAGVEMIEAAAKLDEQDEPERALWALSHVQYWSSLLAVEPMDGAIEAANALAERRGWGALAKLTEAVLREGRGAAEP